MKIKTEIKPFYIHAYPSKQTYTKNNILIDESNSGIRRKFAVRILLLYIYIGTMCV